MRLQYWQAHNHSPAPNEPKTCIPTMREELIHSWSVQAKVEKHTGAPNDA